MDPKGSIDYKDIVEAGENDVNYHEITHPRRIVQISVLQGSVEVDYEMDDTTQSVTGNSFILVTPEKHIHDFGQRFRRKPPVPDKTKITALQPNTKYTFTLEFSEARTAARSKLDRS